MSLPRLLSRYVLQSLLPPAAMASFRRRWLYAWQSFTALVRVRLAKRELWNPPNQWHPSALRILVLEDAVPIPSRGAGFPRSHAIVERLALAGHEVTVFPTEVFCEDATALRAVYDATVRLAVKIGAINLRYFLDREPNNYDVVLACRPRNLNRFARLRRCPPAAVAGAAVVYDAEALFALRTILRAEWKGNRLAMSMGKRRLLRELRQAADASAVISASAYEAELLRASGCKNVHVVRHRVTAQPTEARFEDRNIALFVGPMYSGSPNAEAMLWFSAEVLPLILERVPEFRTVAVGVASVDVEAELESRGVELAGHVSHLNGVYEACRVFVAPVLFGAGVPLKIYEAAARGVPVTTTSLGAFQLGWSDGVELRSSHSAEGFAAGCIELWSDPTAWGGLRHRALQRVLEQCNEDRFSNSLLTALSSINGRDTV